MFNYPKRPFLKVGLFSAILLSISTLNAFAASPSFDCRKAETQIEILICSVDELASLDKQVASLYKNRIRETSKGTRESERVAQRVWLDKRNGCIDEQNIQQCVNILYTERISELSQKQERPGEGRKKVMYMYGGRMGYYFKMYLLDVRKMGKNTYSTLSKRIDNEGKVELFRSKVICDPRNPQIADKTGKTRLDRNMFKKDFFHGGAALYLYSLWWTVCRNNPKKYVSDWDSIASIGVRSRRKYYISVFEKTAVRDFGDLKKVILKFKYQNKRPIYKRAFVYCFQNQTIYIDNQLLEIYKEPKTKLFSSTDLQGIVDATCQGEYKSVHGFNNIRQNPK